MKLLIVLAVQWKEEKSNLEFSLKSSLYIKKTIQDTAVIDRFCTRKECRIHLGSIK